ncbi:hypothetical protein GLOTRDRAFT_138329 [Gloeophyllum trabeum ATCC 11539]|uniref:Uncharacterized protein n=1 Tax=Gloeophyllum trabeum (strain ATCC 11539 / FP-39264 / Madison 617) TaxID=670483 RepID=S7QBD9_GLOTA|nr:uncharacterized protein GLOTRDRAFT_138329 [Gloeophyllum trabeum ATCC 11539]EPQ56662.1 hypothetical protein GLOTRDRAFT_138329 [Gloeophyllum trabeum ATCC 11539]
MYRASTPVFDVPEFPSMRRVKPLPKRRRVTMEPLPQDVPPHDADDELDSLSAQMALQSYYMPILGGVQDLLLKSDFGAGALDVFGDARERDGADRGRDRDRDGGEEDEQGDGDYVDHLQQPGNTKKRKVPANAQGSAHRGLDASPAQSGEEEELPDRGAARGDAADVAELERAGTPAPGALSLAQKKGRLSKATKVGLAHKELLRHRRRQLSAVLGALSLGDTLALDQALSANYPFANRAPGGDPKSTPPPKVRPSRRKAARVARALRVLKENVPAALQRQERALPEAEFTFDCHSATSERLVATKEEVAALHARFEVELARQAAKAAEAAKAAASSLSKAKRTERSKQRARTAKATAAIDQNNSSSVDSALANGVPNKPRTKKKKRSALANASNPHHLRNYVPSRLPHSGGGAAAQAGANAQSFVSPPPLRFLAAEIPPRRRKKSEVTPAALPTNPADEWICPFCEYDLFYGDEARFRRAVRNRKTILKRRRRARERAAAAASGKGSARAPEKKDAVDDDVNPGFAPPHADVPAENKWTGDGGGAADDRGGRLQNSAGLG